ncbi:MAG: transcriptional regulator [Mycobacterium sp.]|nr:transcriptional regulator [Mycobacterium sp.]
MPDPPTPATIAEPLPVRLLQETASMFGLLSAAVRLRILWLLADGDCDVGTLAAATGESVATVNRHLSKLKLAGSVRARRDGRRHVYVVADPHIVDVIRVAIANGSNAHRHRIGCPMPEPTLTLNG